MKKGYIRVGLGLVIAFVFLWLMLRQIDAGQLVDTLKQARSTYLASAVLVFMFGYVCRVARWRLMLSKENPDLLLRACLGPFFASVAMNNVLPLRAGDVLRAFGFNKALKVGASTSVTSLVVERLLDLLMVVCFLGLGLAYFNMDASRLVGMSSGLLLVGGAAILLFLLCPTVFRPVTGAVAALARAVSPGVGERVRGAFENVYGALGHVSKASTMAKLVAWSLAAWLAEGVVFWLVALAIPALTEPAAAWLALPVATLATTIPSTPGYVGTFDYFAKIAMTAVGNTPESAAAFAFAVHFVLWLPPTVVGGLFMLYQTQAAAKNQIP